MLHLTTNSLTLKPGDIVITKYQEFPGDVLYKFATVLSVIPSKIHEACARYDIKFSTGEIQKNCYLHNRCWYLAEGKTPKKIKRKIIKYAKSVIYTFANKKDLIKAVRFTYRYHLMEGTEKYYKGFN